MESMRLHLPSIAVWGVQVVPNRPISGVFRCRGTPDWGRLQLRNRVDCSLTCQRLHLRANGKRR